MQCEKMRHTQLPESYGVGHILGAIVTPITPEPSAERDSMDFAGLSDERETRSVATATHMPSAARDRRGCPPPSAVVRPPLGHVRPTGPSPARLTTNRPPSALDRPAAADTADQRQADYFLRLLIQNRRLIEQRIEGYYKAIALAEAKNDQETASVFRHTASIEEQERETLDALIENLHRRFPIRLAPDAPAAPRGPRVLAR